MKKLNLAPALLPWKVGEAGKVINGKFTTAGKKKFEIDPAKTQCSKHSR